MVSEETRKYLWKKDVFVKGLRWDVLEPDVVDIPR